MENKTIKIAITDDSELFREALKLIFSQEECFRVVLVARNGNELINSLEKQETLPDIVILDLIMPIMDGIETTITLKEYFPEIKILILTEVAEIDAVQELMNLGVDGYLTKDVNSYELIEAIRNIIARGRYFEGGKKTSC